MRNALEDIRERQIEQWTEAASRQWRAALLLTHWFNSAVALGGLLPPVKVRPRHR